MMMRRTRDLQRVFLKYLQLYWRQILSLVLAGILVWAVRGKKQDNKQASMLIPEVVVKMNLPAGVFCSQGMESVVQLAVQGSEWQLARLTSESFTGYCPVQCGNLNSAVTRTVVLRPDMFRPKHSGVTIKRILPSKLELKLDRIESRRLPVRQVFDSVDRLPEGYEIRRVTVHPDQVTVSGPSAVIRALRQVRTMPVPLDGTVREGFDYVVSLQQLNNVQMQSDQVTVHVEIGAKAAGERSLNRIPCHLLLSEEQRKTLTAELAAGTLPEAEVVVRGPDDIRAVLQPSWIRVFADLTGIRRPGVYTIPLTGVFLTPDARKLELLRISPARVKVAVRRKSDQ